jgi:hypothetical protein
MRRSTVLIAVVALFTVASLAHSNPRPRAALNTVLPDLNFTGVTIADAIDFLRDVSGANIHVNWQALEAVGVGQDTTINLRMRNVPLRKVLQMILREAGSGDLLTFHIDEGVIEVTTRELADEQMFTRVYPVDDLIMEVPDFVGPAFNLAGSSAGGTGGGGSIITGTSGAGDVGLTRAERAEQLIDTIQAVIYPDIWDVNGGRAAIRFLNGALIVTAPRSVHESLGRNID